MYLYCCCMCVCAGHGFKLSPVVGKLIAELVTGQKPSHDLTPFRVTRFLTPKSPL